MIAEETGVLFRWREKLALCLVLLNSSELLYVY